MKLILIALIPLILISLCSMAGLGTTIDSQFHFNMQYNPDGTPKVLYDSSGWAVCYYNGTEVAGNTPGDFVKIDIGEQCGWYNGTLITYPLFYDAAATETVNWADIQNPIGLGVRPSGVLGDHTFDIAGSLGLIAFIVVMMAVGTLAGLHFFGSGLSEISVDLLFKGTAYVTIWGIFSLLSYNIMFDSGQFILYILYFGLTVIYTLGIVNSIGHPSGDF